MDLSTGLLLHIEFLWVALRPPGQFLTFNAKSISKLTIKPGNLTIVIKTSPENSRFDVSASIYCAVDVILPLVPYESLTLSDFDDIVHSPSSNS